MAPAHIPVFLLQKPSTENGYIDVHTYSWRGVPATWCPATHLRAWWSRGKYNVVEPCTRAPRPLPCEGRASINGSATPDETTMYLGPIPKSAPLPRPMNLVLSKRISAPRNYHVAWSHSERSGVHAGRAGLTRACYATLLQCMLVPRNSASSCIKPNPVLHHDISKSGSSGTCLFGGVKMVLPPPFHGPANFRGSWFHGTHAKNKIKLQMC